MTFTLDIPEVLASELTALFPQEERNRFAVSAIADALSVWKQEADARVAESLLTELDPELEPEREAAECRAIVEEGLKEIEAGHNLVSFEEACHRWEEEKAQYQNSVILCMEA